MCVCECVCAGACVCVATVHLTLHWAGIHADELVIADIIDSTLQGALLMMIGVHESFRFMTLVLQVAGEHLTDARSARDSWTDSCIAKAGLVL